MKLTIAGCPLRAQIKKDVETRVAAHPGVRDVTIDWGEMTADERSEVMLEGAVGGAGERARHRRSPPPPACSPSRRGRAASARAPSPSTSPPRIAAAGYTVGVLDADIWGFSVPRMLGMDDRLEAHVVDGSDRPLILPHERAVGAGLLKVVSTGLLVEDEGTALMWRGLMLTKAVEQFLRDVHWGPLDYLLIDMPPGTGDVQMGLARLLPAHRPHHRHHPCGERPEGRHPGRRHGPAIVPARRRRHREHERLHLRARQPSTRLFGEGGGRALADEVGVELLGQVPIEPAVAAGGDAGEPVALAGTGPAADAVPGHRPHHRHRDASPRSPWPAARPVCSTPSKPPSAPPAD